MKVAVLHDWLDVLGGGEKISLVLARELDADYYSLDVDWGLVEKAGFGDVNVFEAGVTVGLPVVRQVQASIIFRRLNLMDDYDAFVLSGNMAAYAAAKNHPNVYYCHTPTRAFFSDRSMVRDRQLFLARPFFTGWAGVHGVFEKKSVESVDVVVTNSETTRARIRKYYGLDSEVVYTGVYLDDYSYGEPEGYWLSVNRLYPEKRVELQLEAFRLLPDLKLKVVGGHSPSDSSRVYRDGLMESAPENVEFLGSVGDEELRRLYSGCRGLVATACDEDLGLTPIEAMASGKPVVAVNEGGYMETVVDGATGRLVEADPSRISEVVREVDGDLVSYRRACFSQAGLFSVEAFTERVRGALGEACSR